LCERCQDEAQQDPQPGEDEAQVVADCGEDGVRGVAGTALEVAAAEVAVGFHVSDHSLDGGSAPQFALDDAEDAALLAGDEDAARIGRIVAAISLVDIGALDLTSAPTTISFLQFCELGVL
jgi:hypothetical protein